jgi:hypothetical protein
MGNGTEQQPPQAGPAERLVPWSRVKRNTAHRISDHTTDFLNGLSGEMKAARRKSIAADTVIFAALRIAARGGLGPLLDEARVIENDLYTVLPHPEPGS